MQSRYEYFQERMEKKKQTNQDNRPIGSACFIIFKSQKEASMASQACLFTDNTEPTIQLAPHYEEVLWHNIGAQKSEQFWYSTLFWIIMVLLFVIYFVPSTLLMGLFSESSSDWYNDVYNGVCVSGFSCNPHMSITGASIEDTGGLLCYACYMGSSLFFTYLPTITSAIFMTLLPLLINALLFIPKYKTKTQRYKTKFQCLLTFLILIQGFLSVIMGAAQDENGVLNID